MKVEELVEIINGDFYCGVPDSQLSALCDYLMDNFGISNKHIIAANEGNAVGLAAGYHMATGQYPVVYMQNSGIGNTINPIASLLNREVYGIPCIFIVGWRGEPGVHDEPQHVFQGEVTLKLLEDMNIATTIIDANTDALTIENKMKEYTKLLEMGESVAFVVKKGALSYKKNISYQNNYCLNREEVLEYITSFSEEDIIISTTGKISRELFEIREKNGVTHARDFLTVGSMGHCSSIALGIAMHQPNRKIWCIDGDGAALMHMGAIGVIGNMSPKNMIHIVIDNGAHETVGGMPTVSEKISWENLFKSVGYEKISCVENTKDLKQVLEEAKNESMLTAIIIKCQISSRADLGRPTIKAIKNKENFMEYIKIKAGENDG